MPAAGAPRRRITGSERGSFEGSETMAKSKKYVDASRRYDKQALHEPTEAFELVKSMATKKFDETVEAAFRLGVDPRKADQMLRGTVSVPAGTRPDGRGAALGPGSTAPGTRHAAVHAR